MFLGLNYVFSFWFKNLFWVLLHFIFFQISYYFANKLKTHCYSLPNIIPRTTYPKSVRAADLQISILLSLSLYIRRRSTAIIAIDPYPNLKVVCSNRAFLAFRYPKLILTSNGFHPKRTDWFLLAAHSRSMDFLDTPDTRLYRGWFLVALPFLLTQWNLHFYPLFYTSHSP